MQYKRKMISEVRNIILLSIFLLNSCVFALENSNDFFNIKPKILNSKKYISFNSINKNIIPNSVIKNKYTLEFDDIKIKVYPSSFYMLVERNTSTVYQFNYPVINFENELLLPYDQTLNIIFDLLQEKKSKRVLIKTPDENKDKKALSNNSKSHSESKSMIRMNNEEILLENPEIEKNDQNIKIKTNDSYYINKAPKSELGKSIDEIAPMIDDSFDYLLLDGSYEIRQQLKSKSDSTDGTFSPDSYRIPKNLKRKLK